MILVVDDHVGLGQGIRLMLEEAGHAAAHVPSGEAALAFVRAERPLLVLLDQNMPGMSGIEVLRHLRGQPGLRDVPVIMNSAVVDPVVEREARLLGVWAFLAKGSDEWDDLIGLVEKCVGGAPGRTLTPAKRGVAAG